MERIQQILRRSFEIRKRWLVDGKWKGGSNREVEKAMGELRQVMGGLNNEAIGKLVDLQEVKRAMESERKRVGYLHLYEGEGVTLCGFALPQGISLPLHDHPNMWVFSSVVMGELNCTSCHLQDNIIQVEIPQLIQQAQDISSQQALQDKADLLMSQRECEWTSQRMNCSSGVKVTSPKLNNVHSFQAMQDSLLIDLLIPSYDSIHHSCNFYSRPTPNTIKGHWTTPDYSTYII